MKQLARILTDMEDGFLNGKRYLIHDRDPLYTTEGFHDILKVSGIKPIILPPYSPDLNCYAERFVKSVKSECLDHLILSSVEQLEYVLRQFGDYYNHDSISS
jgi:putative transposase